MSRKIDLTGSRFGKLVVLSETKSRKRRGIVWKCQCDCGEVVYSTSHCLKSNHVRSCGCLRINNLAGKRFGRLVVLRSTKKRNIGNVKWLCVCDCGIEVIVNGGDLLRKKGATKSCGCFRRDYRSETMKKFMLSKVLFVYLRKEPFLFLSKKSYRNSPKTPWIFLHN